MTLKDRILAVLTERKGPLCDDCLAAVVQKARQQVFSRCREMGDAGEIGRGDRLCIRCGKVKHTSWRLDSPFAAVTIAPPPAAGADRPWYWEGNVQARIVAYLTQQGYTVSSFADTASREQGKDIVAVGPDSHELWVSVKGYPSPKPSAATQARHWFSHAVFDLILYHDENPRVSLAIGLPGGYATYRRLASRVGWLQRQLAFRILWVDEQGQVTEEVG